MINNDLYPNLKFYHAHIPKTGGTSLWRMVVPSKDAPDKDLNCGLPNCCSPRMRNRTDAVKFALSNKKCSFFSYELYRRHVENIMKESPKVYKGITFLRDPLAHSLSALQHMETYHKDDCKNVTQYLSGTGCHNYDLHNMQTGRLGSSLKDSVATIDSLFFLGITDYYDESICLLRYQLGQISRKLCECEHKTVSAKPKNVGHYHGQYTPDDLHQLYDMTVHDSILFNHGLRIFFSRIQQAEKALGYSLVCPRTPYEKVTQDGLRSFSMLGID